MTESIKKEQILREEILQKTIQYYKMSNTLVF